MFWRKSIISKMLLGIILPMVVVFVFAGTLILDRLKDYVVHQTTDELAARSESASFQVSEFFTRYMEIAKQTANNYQLKKLFSETNSGEKAKDAESFSDVVKTLDSVAGNDKNIKLLYTGDFDSGESVRPGGVVRGLPEYVLADRPFYQTMIDKKAQFIVEPYVTATDKGEMVTSIMSPIMDGSNILGLVAIDITISSLSNMMSSYKLEETGFFILATPEGTLVHHPDARLVGKRISDSGLSQNILDGFTSKQTGNYIYKSDGVECYGHLSLVGDTGWMVLTGLPSQEFYTSYNEICKTIMLIFGFGLVGLVIITLLISMGITRPLARLSKIANQLAEGNLDVTLDIKSADETGRVAVALGHTVDRLKDYIKYIDEISEILHKIATGNVDFKLIHSYEGEFSKVKVELLNISETLSNVFCNIRQSSDQVQVGSMQISQSGQILAEGATEQAGSLQRLSSTVSEISEQVSDNAANATEVSVEVKKLGVAIQNSNVQMLEMSEAMSKIRSSSNEIGKIIKTVEDIAFQTNILALNAAVEAARAGSAGKGFAVVADEVRSLAGKSAQAAENTTSLIESSLTAMEKGVRIADETAESLHCVVEAAGQVVDIVDNISKASQSQSSSIADILNTIDTISEVVQTNAATSEEIASSSQELANQSQILNEMVNKFKYKELDDMCLEPGQQLYS